MFSIPSQRTRPLALVLACMVLAGCGGEDPAGNGATANAQPAGEDPARSSPAVGVLTEAVRQEPFDYEVEALGTARANEAVEITSKVANLVTAIRFREGEQVRRGATLVELDSVEARAELAAARAALAETESQLKRSRELFATQALSQAQLDQLGATLSANQARVTTAQSRLADTVIRAPFDGRTGLRRVSVGSLVTPGTVITTLDDMRVIKLDFSVPEAFIAVLVEGLPLTARSVAFPDREFTGKVVSIDSRVDPTSRSVIARAELPNPQSLLKPGMFLTVRLREKRAPALLISEQALVPEEGRQYVYVVADGRAQKREITIGRRAPGKVEVVTGLKPGETVVVEGTQKVRDGGPVRDVSREPAAPAA
ncbi:MAG TPA: efflux RND transporter periplasmic adaptor subunit [Steroidobacteraceae bacterium]|nr:efflux RND transporter periplasmic adaptor subunit [Steroidobacteraceae bacterium]